MTLVLRPSRLYPPWIQQMLLVLRPHLLRNKARPCKESAASLILIPTVHRVEITTSVPQQTILITTGATSSALGEIPDLPCQDTGLPT